jgi:hypothetical protein
MDESNGQAEWSFHNDDGTTASADAENTRPAPQPISWTGSEYIAQHKDAGWYTVFVIVVGLFCVGTYFLTSRDILSVISIIIIGILFAIIAGRKPSQRNYTIDESGLTVDSKLYPYSMFKSFSVIHDGAIGYISLFPLERFKPELAIYYPPDHEQQIFEFLSVYLPYEQREESRVDRLSKKIRF